MSNDVLLPVVLPKQGVPEGIELLVHTVGCSVHSGAAHTELAVVVQVAHNVQVVRIAVGRDVNR